MRGSLPLRTLARLSRDTQRDPDGDDAFGHSPGLSGSAIAPTAPPAPVLVGDHSEKRHCAALDRIDSKMCRGLEEGSRAEHYASRADTAAGYERHRKDPARTLRCLLLQP
ncbi:DUF3560 domain-containing protein [Streptomyces sp. NPDC056891]|uniref:DUF3560 domain-containing protein n=1 Tax=Streptomyces sp. NPDC056891 TaxID=3345961 RepID=UPI003682D011